MRVHIHLKWYWSSKTEYLTSSSGEVHLISSSFSSVKTIGSLKSCRASWYGQLSGIWYLNQCTLYKYFQGWKGNIIIKYHEPSIQKEYFRLVVTTEKQVNLIPQGYVMRLTLTKLHKQKMVIFNRKKKNLSLFMFSSIFSIEPCSRMSFKAVCPPIPVAHIITNYIIYIACRADSNIIKPSLDQASYK